MATSVWTETFVLLHGIRGGKCAVASSHSVALFSSLAVSSTRRCCMTTLAYLRVSKDTQDTKNQRLAILEFAHAEGIVVDEFLELQASSRRSAKIRKVDLLLARLAPGDTLLVSELSRLGRSVGEIITLIDTLVTQQIRVFALKEGLRLTGAHDLQTTVMVTLFGLFAEIERTLLSLRTKEALAVAKAAGKRLGRPRGTLGKSKLDGKKEEIKTLLALRVSKASIAKITGVDRATLYHFIHSRGLMPK